MKLSLYLMEKGYFRTRSQARNALKEGLIKVNGRTITKDGFEVQENDDIQVKLPERQYVSRGGKKLEAALRHFKISVSNAVCLDIGASTGGFTDCLLQHGASKVYAFDVGSDQLAESLMNDPRVISKEHINCRTLTRDDFAESIDIIVMDVSFISSTIILPNISDILSDGRAAVILFKPQFEVGAEHLNNKGVAKNDIIIKDKLDDMIAKAAALELKCQGYIESPIKGQNGNQEYLVYFIKE